MPSNTITEVMTKHHLNIDKLLNKFNRELKEKSITGMETFNKFKWELEKHFFLEEKAIFQSHYSSNIQTNEISTRLKDEHDKIIQELEKIEMDIKLNKSIEFNNLREMIIKHKNYENRHFYPLLDDELDDDNVKKIVDRLSNAL
jgi:hypothetical protein